MPTETPDKADPVLQQMVVQYRAHVASNQELKKELKEDRELLQEELEAILAYGRGAGPLFSEDA